VATVLRALLWLKTDEGFDSQLCYTHLNKE